MPTGEGEGVNHQASAKEAAKHATGQKRAPQPRITQQKMSIVPNLKILREKKLENI